MENHFERKGHPILGIVLAILGIAAAMFLCLLTGLIGGGIALLFGVIALLLGIFAVKGGKKGGGIASIILALIAIVLAVVLTVSTIAGFREMKKVVSAEETPLMAKYLDRGNLNLGFVGILMGISKEEMNDQTAEELRKEMEFLDQKVNKTTPAAEPATAQ